MSASFTYPETIQSQAAQMNVKSRKIEGGFEGCCAVYFMGRRVGYGHAKGATRHRAMRNAEVAAGYRQIESALTLGSNY